MREKKQTCGFGKFIIVFSSVFCFGATRTVVIPAQLQKVNVIHFHKLEADLLWITSFLRNAIKQIEAIN